MTIQNKTFIITGGASGLGAATAEMIVANGGNAILADINPETGQQTQQTLGARSLFVATDVSQEDSVQNTVNQAIQHFGGLHGVINCAGISPGERVVGRNGPHSLELFSKTISVNLIGTFNVLRLVAAALQNNPPSDDGERGVIINTASVAAFEGQIGQAAYSASKGGIVSMTLPIARELARMGIRVMTIAPGLFETPLMAGFSEEVRTSLGQQVPFPARLGRPAEYAALVQHIIENTMLNGEVIRLDGAIRMSAK
ncbi:MAG: 3-hydroxyacyl-CoA dehydrogenase [Runella sp.]